MCRHGVVQHVLTRRRTFHGTFSDKKAMKSDIFHRFLVFSGLFRAGLPESRLWAPDGRARPSGKVPEAAPRLAARKPPFYINYY